MISTWDIVFRLFLATMLSGFIGWERELHERPAGFRTHILVCVGSTLAMIISLSVHEVYGSASDPGRIAAQVISGIGFLGAGTIIREGASVRGLTTAASLWAVAGIGLAIGSGLYIGGLMASFLVFLSLWSLSKLEFRAASKVKTKHLHLQVRDRPGIIGHVGSILGEADINILNVRMEHLDVYEELLIEFKVQPPPECNLNELTHRLAECEGVLQIEWNHN